MGLRRKRKVESELAELFELVRAELESMRAEMHDGMAETAAVLSIRVRSEIEQRMGEPSAIVSGIQDVREIIAGRDSELVAVLHQVGATCEALAEQVQGERIERTALAEAIKRLTNSLVVGGTFALPPPTSATPTSGSTSSSRETVIGGTVDPARTEAVETGRPLEIDLEEVDLDLEADGSERAGRPLHPDGVEVRCRFGDRWVTGFEVCEVIRLDDVTRYRLRRRSDGSVIPTLFEEKDLRFFSTSYGELT
jgi:predicted phage tail protein